MKTIYHFCGMIGIPGGTSHADGLYEADDGEKLSLAKIRELCAEEFRKETGQEVSAKQVTLLSVTKLDG